MRAVSLPLLIACLAVAPATAQQPPRTAAEEMPRLAYDPYDPVLLNEFAIDSVRQGDLTTAWILLERAARLAPYDARISRNLRELQAYRTGRPAPSGTPAPIAGPSAATGVPAEPPPLWPLR